MAEERYLAALAALPGMGPRRLKRVLAALGGAGQAWEAGAEAIAQAAGMGAQAVEALRAARRRLHPDALWEAVARLGLAVLIRGRPGYPQPLADLPEAPEVLYCKGEWLEADARAVAVVGSRRADWWGLAAAERLARELAAAGITVVSGLARGVDGAAHRAALGAGGRTVAVLGSGLDAVYPPEHRGLAERVAAHGALLSEFPPGTPPRPWHFPWRNRIIAGLSAALVVVQAGAKSGALSTVDWALDQGREVFVCPADLGKPAGAGNIRLLAEGAALCLSAADVLERLGWQGPAPAEGTMPQGQAGAGAAGGGGRKGRGGLDDIEERVCALLSAEPQHPDELAARSGLPVAAVSAALFMLELCGRARQVPGSLFVQAPGQDV